MIPFTRPYLPDKAAFRRRLDTVWSSCRVTNGGPMTEALTDRLADYLGVDHLLLVANGTLALEVALRALGVRGHVVTTPYTFGATSAAIRAVGCVPIYGPVDEATLNLDLSGIGVGPDRAVVSVHTYGNPALDEYDDATVVFDAAQAFGVTVGGRSVLAYGDTATLSLHATKILHTGEGGAIAFRDPAHLEIARGLIQFEPVGYGRNAKMSEIHAALGLSVLDEIDAVMDARREAVAHYMDRLDGAVEFQRWHPQSERGVAYMPVLFPCRESRDGALRSLNAAEIEARPGFPPLDPLAYALSGRILCLPLYAGLSRLEIDRICDHVCWTAEVAA